MIPHPAAQAVSKGAFGVSIFSGGIDTIFFDSKNVNLNSGQLLLDIGTDLVNRRIPARHIDENLIHVVNDGINYAIDSGLDAEYRQ